MSDSPVSARLLQRLADVADMNRTGEPIWIAAGSDPAGDVIVGTNEDDVRTKARSKRDYTIHGPYRPPERETEWGWKLVGVQVTMESTKGEERVVDVDLDTVDALFLSESATEKFALPYLAQRYGPRYAAGWVEEFRKGGRAHAPICCHILSLIRFDCLDKPKGK